MKQGVVNCLSKKGFMVDLLKQLAPCCHETGTPTEKLLCYLSSGTSATLKEGCAGPYKYVCKAVAKCELSLYFQNHMGFAEKPRTVEKKKNLDGKKGGEFSLQTENFKKILKPCFPKGCRSISRTRQKQADRPIYESLKIKQKAENCTMRDLGYSIR